MHPNLEARVEAIPQRFLALLAVRDFPGLAATVSPAVRARLLLPHGLEEHVGREAVIGRFKDWFGSAAEFKLASSTQDMVGPRHRLSWRLSVVRQPGRNEDIEQIVFLNVGPDGIERLDLMCSGFQIEAEAAQCSVHVFDAGAMGCGDGLAQEFRRRLSEIAVGDSISVVVRDPAAKEDLPALARMLGQSVTAVEAHDDGRLEIKVEKRK